MTFIVIFELFDDCFFFFFNLFALRFWIKAEFKVFWISIYTIRNWASAHIYPTDD